MKKSYVHYKDRLEIYKNITFVFLILFLGFGIYKNGLTYYFMGRLSFKDATSIIVFPIISILECGVIERIFTKKNTKNSLIIGLLCSLMVPPLFPVLSFMILTGCFYILYFLLKDHFKTLCFLAIYKGILMLYTFIFSVPLENFIENVNSYFYGTIDSLFGYGIGGFGTTNIFLILLLFLILCSYFYYKKELPIISMVTYSILFFICLLLRPDQFILQSFFDSSFFFCTVLLLPITTSSPVIRRVKILYAVFFGVLSFFLIHFFHIKEGAYLSLIFVNFLWSIVHKLVYKEFK